MLDYIARHFDPRLGSYSRDIAGLHPDHIGETEELGSFANLIRGLRTTQEPDSTQKLNGVERHIPLSRNIDKITSDLFIDSILVNTVRSLEAPYRLILHSFFPHKPGEAIPAVGAFRKFRDFAAYSAKFDIVAIHDPIKNKTRAFKKIHSEMDVAPDELSTGFSAVCYAEIALSEVQQKDNCRNLVAALNIAPANLHLTGSVRIAFKGHQFNYPAVTSLARAARGEVPSQMARVLPFCKTAREKLDKYEYRFPPIVNFSAHSAGSVLAMLANLLWHQHSDLKSIPVASVTHSDPVLYGQGLRQVACLAAICESLRGNYTTAQHEAEIIHHNQDIISVDPSNLWSNMTFGLGAAANRIPKSDRKFTFSYWDTKLLNPHKIRGGISAHSSVTMPLRIKEDLTCLRSTTSYQRLALNSIFNLDAASRTASDRAASFAQFFIASMEQFFCERPYKTENYLRTLLNHLAEAYGIEDKAKLFSLSTKSVCATGR